MSGYIPAAGTAVQQSTGTSFPELYDSSNSAQTSQQTAPQIITSQQPPGGIINNPTTPNFTTRLANTFGALNPIQQTFDKFSPIPQRNVFARFQQNSHSGPAGAQSSGSNFYRFDNFGSQPNSQSNPIGISNPLAAANLTVPAQFRSANDSPNYIQLAAEKVASLLNTDSVQLKNTFGSNFFSPQTQPQQPQGFQRSFLSRTTGNLSGAFAGVDSSKTASSISMGLGTHQIGATQVPTNQAFYQSTQQPQSVGAAMFQPMSVPGQGSSINPGPSQHITQAQNLSRGQLDGIYLGINQQQIPGQVQNVGMYNPSQINQLSGQATQFLRKPQNIIAQTGAFPQSLSGQSYTSFQQNPNTLNQNFSNVANNITAVPSDADQRFRRSKDLYQQSLNAKLTQSPGIPGVNSGFIPNSGAVVQSGVNSIQPVGTYQTVYSDSQLNQQYGLNSQLPSNVNSAGTSSVLGHDPMPTLARQPVYVSMDGGLNLVSQQKSAGTTDPHFQQQNMLSTLDRSRAFDRLSLEQIYSQQRSRSLDQSENINATSNPAVTGSVTPNVPAHLLPANHKFPPQFPIDLAHRLHAQHASGHQIPSELASRSILDSNYRSMDDPLMKASIDGVPNKSVSFNVSQHSPINRESLTKLSELFPDCAECRRLEESRRLYRASLKLRKGSVGENWSDYMKENDRYISSQDEESLRKLAKMVSATFSGDSDSADSEARFSKGFSPLGVSSDYPYTSRLSDSGGGKLGRGFGSMRSLPSSYTEHLESNLFRGALDSPGSLRSRKTTSLSEIDMQRRLEIERDMYRPNGKSRAPSFDYLANAEYAKAAAYAAELNQKLGAFTAEMENLSMDNRPKTRGRSRDRKNEKDRRMSSRDGTSAVRERSKSRTIDDVNNRIKQTSPEQAKMSRRLDRIGKSARDYSPVGVTPGNGYSDNYPIETYGTMRSRNRSSSRNRGAYEDLAGSFASRRRVNSTKEKPVFMEDETRKKLRDRSRDTHSRRGSCYDSRTYERSHGLRDAESSSSSIDRLSSPDRRNRKSGHGFGQNGQFYDSFQRSSRERTPRDRGYSNTVDLDRNRKLPDTPGINYSTESGYSSQSQRATREDNERYARNNSSNQRGHKSMNLPNASKNNSSGYHDNYENEYQRQSGYHNEYNEPSIRVSGPSEYDAGGYTHPTGYHDGGRARSPRPMDNQGPQGHHNRGPQYDQPHPSQSHYANSNSINNANNNNPNMNIPDINGGMNTNSQNPGNPNCNFSNNANKQGMGGGGGHNNSLGARHQDYNYQQDDPYYPKGIPNDTNFPHQNHQQQPVTFPAANMQNQNSLNNNNNHNCPMNNNNINKNNINPGDHQHNLTSNSNNIINTNRSYDSASSANVSHRFENTPHNIAPASVGAFAVVSLQQAERCRNERQMLLEQSHRCERYLLDGIVPDDTKDFVKTTVNRTRQLLDDKLSRAMQLCEQNLDKNASQQLLGSYPTFNQLWRDVSDEISSLQEDFALIQQLRANNWTPFNPSVKTTPPQVTKPYNGSYYDDTLTEDFDNAPLSPNDEVYSEKNDSRYSPFDTLEDESCYTSGKLKKHVVKTPKRTRPLTTTAASRAQQEVRRRKQISLTRQNSLPSKNIAVTQ